MAWIEGEDGSLINLAQVLALVLAPARGAAGSNGGGGVCELFVVTAHGAHVFVARGGRAELEAKRRKIAQWLGDSANLPISFGDEPEAG
jgi:hypothetical protein